MKKFLIISAISIISLVFFISLISIISPAFAATLNSSMSQSYRQGLGLNRGLVGWWTMDGQDVNATQILDKSPSNVSLTKNGTTRATGKIGQGISCNGTTDYALSGSTVSGSSGYITVAAWIKYRGTWNNPIAVDRGTDWRLLSGAEASAVASAMYSSTVDAWGTRVSGTTVLRANTWYYIAFTFDGANAKIWVNGVVDGTKVATGTLNVANILTAICTYNGISSNFLNGQIDDVRIYSRALSASEVKQLYNMGR